MPTINLFSEAHILYRKIINLTYGIFLATLFATVFISQLYFHNLQLHTNNINNVIRRDKKILSLSPPVKDSGATDNLDLLISKSINLYHHQQNALSILQSISKLTPHTIKLSALILTDNKLILTGDATDAIPVSSYAKTLSQTRSLRACITNDISITPSSLIHFTFTCHTRKAHAQTIPAE